MVRLDLDRLRQLAKARKRATGGTLAQAQLALAREHGQSSWRALVDHVRIARTEPAAPIPEERVDQFLRDVGLGNLDAVTQALAETPAIVNAVGRHPFWGGRPQPLHVAIETNRWPMIQRLLRAGADVNGTNEEYSRWSPLLLAIHNEKRGKTKRALLARGAKVGVVEALAMGDDAKVLRMLRRGKSALPPAPNDGSLLAFAKTPAAIDRLLALGVPTDTKDRWGADPIEAMSRAGKKGAPLVRHLAARGVAVRPEELARIGDRRGLATTIDADPSVATRPTVVKAAVDFGQHALVEWLLDRGADPNARSNATSHGTCLHSAAWNGDAKMVELLLKRGANPLLLDDDHQNTPAGWAETAVGVTNNDACRAVAERLRREEKIQRTR
jgi:ankyrin repeat protein